MQVFIKFQSMVERLLNEKIKSVQIDWGGEYRNLHKYFQSIGILHLVSCPHTHRQQGCVERKHRHLIDTTLALLATSSLPKKFWDDAYLTSCYLINRLSTPLLKNLSPFEKLFSQVPDYKFLKVFGCQCFPNLRTYNSHKFSLRSEPCVFLGYSTSHKGYKCYHPETSRILPLLMPVSLVLLFLLFHLSQNRMCHICSNLSVYILCGPDLKIMSGPFESSLTGQCATLYLGP
jgi:hypothetical protein